MQDAPNQKNFGYTIEEFQSKLIVATILSLVVMFFGLVGRYLTESHTLLHLSFVALALNANMLIGFLSTNKVGKELLRVQYSNLNNQIGFESLMLFSMM